MKVSFDHIEDADVISEQGRPLSDGDSEFLNWLARQFETLAGDERGGWITEALVLANLTNNPKGLREAYKSGKPEIDRYFNQVDIQKVAEQVGPGLQNQIKAGIADRVKNNVPGFIAGSLVAAGIIYGIKTYRQSND